MTPIYQPPSRVKKVTVDPPPFPVSSSPSSFVSTAFDLERLLEKDASHSASQNPNLDIQLDENGDAQPKGKTKKTSFEEETDPENL